MARATSVAQPGRGSATASRVRRRPGRHAARRCGRQQARQRSHDWKIVPASGRRYPRRPTTPERAPYPLTSRPLAPASATARACCRVPAHAPSRSGVRCETTNVPTPSARGFTSMIGARNRLGECRRSVRPDEYGPGIGRTRARRHLTHAFRASPPPSLNRQSEVVVTMLQRYDDRLATFAQSLNDALTSLPAHDAPSLDLWATTPSRSENARAGGCTNLGGRSCCPRHRDQWSAGRRDDRPVRSRDAPHRTDGVPRLPRSSRDRRRILG